MPLLGRNCNKNALPASCSALSDNWNLQSDRQSVVLKFPSIYLRGDLDKGGPPSYNV